MIVGRSQLSQVISHLKLFKKLGLDTETTGLRPWHGDRLFSIIIATGPKIEDAYYFNFQPYPGLEAEFVLLDLHLREFESLFAIEDIVWYKAKSKYDMAILDQEGLTLSGVMHDTVAIGRVEYNHDFEYGLDATLKKIGLAKSTEVDEYIELHKLKEDRKIPGKNTKETIKFFNKVPFDIISRYGLADGAGVFAVGAHQEGSIASQSAEQLAGLPPLSNVLNNERRLTQTIFRMEKRGVLIDREYTVRAARFETDRHSKLIQAFNTETKREFKDNEKLFREIFLSEKDKWVYGKPTKTGKINPSFTSDILKNFENPAAQMVRDLRDAKSKSDFYHGFLYHSDARGYVHPNFNCGGVEHGRFSSSEPNFQNLTSEDIIVCRGCKKGFETVVVACSECGSTDLESPEFLTRRCIIPPPGFLLIMPDYDQMEYRFMFEYACRLVGRETALVREIKGGKDPHQATADLVTALGTVLRRSRAKNGNFALLYGSGDKTLATTIGGTVAEAKALRASIFSVAPEIKLFIRHVMNAAERRGKIFNWYGRVLQFPDKRFAYRAPNYFVSGGCADINKIALNRIDEMELETKSKSHLCMTIHDENPAYVAIDEAHWYPKRVKEIMENVFESKYLPLTCGMEYSTKSLADKVKGFPA